MHMHDHGSVCNDDDVINLSVSLSVTYPFELCNVTLTTATLYNDLLNVCAINLIVLLPSVILKV